MPRRASAGGAQEKPAMFVSEDGAEDLKQVSREQLWANGKSRQHGISDTIIHRMREIGRSNATRQSEIDRRNEWLWSACVCTRVCVCVKEIPDSKAEKRNSVSEWGSHNRPASAAPFLQYCARICSAATRSC